MTSLRPPQTSGGIGNPGNETLADGGEEAHQNSCVSTSVQEIEERVGKHPPEPFRWGFQAKTKVHTEVVIVPKLRQFRPAKRQPSLPVARFRLGQESVQRQCRRNARPPPERTVRFRWVLFPDTCKAAVASRRAGGAVARARRLAACGIYPTRTSSFSTRR
jgi:hypothetical protein